MFFFPFCKLKTNIGILLTFNFVGQKIILVELTLEFGAQKIDL